MTKDSGDNIRPIARASEMTLEAGFEYIADIFILIFVIFGSYL
jgi:hypothetical protein